MADIRINALANTASSTASDDYLAVDGTTNGTRKLSAYSPTFGGNVVATGTLTVNSTTDSSSKDTGAIVTEGGLGVEKSATIGGNLTVSGTGTSTFAGNVAVTGTGTNYTAIDTGSFVKFGNNQTSSNLQVGSQGFGAVLQGAQSGSAAYNILAQPYGGNFLIGTTADGGQKLQVSGTAAISGALSIGNTVQTAVSVASTHKVTISIGGSTYYLLATNV